MQHERTAPATHRPPNRTPAGAPPDGGRVAATVAIAAVVPLLWWQVLAGTRPGWDSGSVQLVARMVLLSVLFWWPAARWFERANPARSAGDAIALGLASPFACLLLALPLAVVLLPLELLLGTPGRTAAFAWSAWLVLWMMPFAILPVGAGMGLVAWAIARCGRRT